MPANDAAPKLALSNCPASALPVHQREGCALRTPSHLRNLPEATKTLAPMSPAPPKLLLTSQGPRLIVYHQTLHDSVGNYHSLLPLVTNNTGITHIILAAIHLNAGPGNITLNDHAPDDKRYEQLWGEVKWLQGSGVKVLGMLGGAAQGSYERLGGSEESVYAPPLWNDAPCPVLTLLVRSLLQAPPGHHIRSPARRHRPRR